jgi:hypothetical protein
MLANVVALALVGVILLVTGHEWIQLLLAFIGLAAKMLK